MNNNNISVRNNQAFSKQYISLLYWMGGVLPGYIDYKPFPIDYKFTQTRKKILLCIIRYCGLHKENYMSHDRIAYLSKCHHDTVLRAIKVFVELGIIKKNNRGANRTCVYSLGSFFHHPRVLWAIGGIFPTIYWSVQSIVRRCKKQILSILSPLRAVYKPITARLLNNKNININTPIKNRYEHTKIPKQEVEMINNYEPDPEHDAFFNEFAKILNISTSEG